MAFWSWLSWARLKAEKFTFLLGHQKQGNVKSNTLALLLGHVVNVSMWAGYVSSSLRWIFLSIQSPEALLLCILSVGFWWIYVPVKSKLQHPPPGQPPGICILCKIFIQTPPSRGRKAVQMPHHRSIPGDQMPPPPGNFSVAFIMLRKLCM